MFSLKKLAEALAASLSREPSTNTALLREPISAAPLPALEINRIAARRQRHRTESPITNQLPVSF